MRSSQEESVERYGIRTLSASPNRLALQFLFASFGKFAVLSFAFLVRIFLYRQTPARGAQLCALTGISRGPGTPGRQGIAGTRVGGRMSRFGAVLLGLTGSAARRDATSQDRTLAVRIAGNGLSLDRDMALPPASQNVQRSPRAGPPSSAAARSGR